MAAAASNAIPDQLEAALDLRSRGKLREALDVLTTPGQNISDFYTVRGDIQLALGRFEEAAGSYFTVVASEPQNTFAQYQLALCLYQLKRWGEAAQAFERVLQSDPHRDQARLGLASCLLYLNRPEEALTNFDSCWSDLARARADFGKAVALQLLGRFQEAQTAYQRLLASEKHVEEVFANLITMNLQLRDFTAVQRYACQLRDIAPKSTLALQALATLAIEDGHYMMAVRYFGQIVELTPDSMEAWHNLRFATSQAMSTLQRYEITAGGK